MEGYSISSFGVILLLELLLANEVFSHTNGLLQLCKNTRDYARYFVYTGILLAKFATISLLLLLVTALPLNIKIFGLDIAIKSIFYFLSALFLISKNFIEIFEIYRLKQAIKKQKRKPLPTLTNDATQKYLIYCLLFSFVESFSLAISVTTNILTIMSGTASAALIIALCHKSISSLNDYYRFKIIFIIFSCILALNLIMASYGDGILSNILFAIIGFAVVCEAVSAFFTDKTANIEKTKKSTEV